MIELFARTKHAKLLDSLPKNFVRNHSSAKIRTEKCPAIRSFDQLGVFLTCPFTINFMGPLKFSVRVYHGPDGKTILCPGVIGEPGSEVLYARIDTGFSLNGAERPLICIGIQSIGFFYQSLRIPATVYPRGYVGPILVPVASLDPVVIESGTPIAQLISLDEKGGSFAIQSTPITHPDFDGLLSVWWDQNLHEYNEISPQELFGM